jgi:hypothetical protein
MPLPLILSSLQRDVSDNYHALPYQDGFYMTIYLRLNLMEHYPYSVHSPDGQN